MAQYILRDVPDDMWDHFKVRAQANGWALRPLFLQLMADYANEEIFPSKAPPPMPDHIRARREMHATLFRGMRDEAQRLIDSQAKDLDPDRGLDTLGRHLYERFAEAAELLRRDLGASRGLPDPAAWLTRPTGETLSRIALRQLISEANQALIVLGLPPRPMEHS